MKKEGSFRFTYFTKMYEETCRFYEAKLGFLSAHSWSRNENDKGTLFKAGVGLIEVLLHPKTDSHRNSGLDYRSPQGVFMCIQVWNIDELFDQFKTMEVPFEQEITDQPWGHRSFSVTEPNGLILFFFQEQF